MGVASTDQKYFNPRSPHGERLVPRDWQRVHHEHFNPRSPHGERPGNLTGRFANWIFQPTLPARGATDGYKFSERIREFQPTLPARGATEFTARKKSCSIFQPTLPARGATNPYHYNFYLLIISTHAPRTGSDAVTGTVNIYAVDFNPRSPHGERQTATLQVYTAENFNPRSPHGERRNQG